MIDWQEKFQITVPGKETGDEPWASLKEQRVVNPQTQLQMPPGYEASGPMDRFTNVIAGETSPSDRRMNLEGDTNIRRGYGLAKMKGTDDQYTGEHADQFYGDAGGFVERNNYLDRE